MMFKRFSEWVALKEQGPVAPNAAGAVPTLRKDDTSQRDSKIKQVMAANLTDTKKRKNALQNLAKQMAMDPNAKPEDIKSVAKAMNDSENNAANPALK